ncbi:MAG: class I SAM-dependent methyltransferase [Acidobacteria bacterium]|nr:class I SAM-dependent methyltransferase [Acidobacteriota bacterium]
MITPSRLLIAALAALSLLSCGRPPATAPADTASRFRALKLEVSSFPVGDDEFRPRLLQGVLDGTPSWRWVEPSFALLVDRPPAQTKELFVELQFGVPGELDLTKGPLTLTCRVNGQQACREQYAAAGDYWMACRVPDAVQSAPQWRVEFSADRSFRHPSLGRTVSLPVIGIGASELEGTHRFQEQQLQRARDSYARQARRWQGVSLEDAREALSVFHKLPTWRSAFFEGVPILKNPLDLWEMQEIIAETKPEFIIETGTLEGGSALLLASILDAAGLRGSKVITIDVATGHRAAEANPLWNQYVEFIHASSSDAAMVQRLAARVKGHRTFVTLDSDHSMVHVLRELKLYSPLIHSGGYLIVEDTHLDGVPSYEGKYVGPMSAVERFLVLDEGKEFSRDLGREPFLMTFNPGGWLRRR